MHLGRVGHPTVEFTDNDAGRAELIVQGLLAEERSHGELEQGLSVVDVERDLIRFRDELEIVSRIGVGFPALRFGDEELVPVSLGLIGRQDRSFGTYPYFQDYRYSEFLLRYYYDLLRRDSLEGFAKITPDQARTSFFRRATNFIATRIAAIRDFDAGKKDGFSKATLNILQRVGGAKTSAPGCSFSVSANSAGLRVFWSGAYYISGNYFGHPTSPTVSVLQAGSFVFGVDGGAYGNVVQWDTAICTLPGKPSVHLNY